MTESTEWNYDTAIALGRAASAAFDAIDAMTAADERASAAMRDLLIDRDATPTDARYDADAATYDALRDCLTAIDADASYPHDEHTTQRLSMLMLDYSLCPMHRCDYAICFDDDDPDCATIRAYFPIHDT